MRLDALDRLLAGFAIIMSAAAIGVAYFFAFGGWYGGFGRLSASLGLVFGAWVVAAVVAGLILVGGNMMRLRVPVVEIFFTLVIGGCAVTILRSFSFW